MADGLNLNSWQQFMSNTQSDWKPCFRMQEGCDKEPENLC